MKKLMVIGAAVAGLATLRSRKRAKSEADAALWREAVKQPPAR